MYKEARTMPSRLHGRANAESSVTAASYRLAASCRDTDPLDPK